MSNASQADRTVGLVVGGSFKKCGPAINSLAMEQLENDFDLLSLLCIAGEPSRLHRVDLATEQRAQAPKLGMAQA